MTEEQASTIWGVLENLNNIGQGLIGFETPQNVEEIRELADEVYNFSAELEQCQSELEDVADEIEDEDEEEDE